MTHVLDQLAALRILPVVVLQDAAQAEPLGRALVDGGLPVAEVTFRTAAAARSIEVLAASGDVLVGAGTVVTVEQVAMAVDAGARFVVSPGLDNDVVEACQDRGVTVIPGVATATEVMAARRHGLEVVKFFPSEQLGGLAMIKALAAPFPTTRFVPTGGITPDSAPNYLAHPAVLAVGGTWMVPGAALEAQEWDRIAELTRTATELAKR